MRELKYYRTLIQIEILSENNPIGDGLNLSEIDYDITEGDCSGEITTLSQEEVTSKQMAELLIAQGSDPSFFMLDKNGNSINDNETEES
jgi:hypothetical protein